MYVRTYVRTYGNAKAASVPKRHAMKAYRGRGGKTPPQIKRHRQHVSGSVDVQPLHKMCEEGRVSFNAQI
jgi:hypothetical protein